jgi:hypothetical protein
MVTFTMPDDYKLPEGVEPDEEWDEIATFKTGDDGKVQLVAIDGNALKDDSDKKKKKPKGIIEKSEEDFDPAAQSGT